MFHPGLLNPLGAQAHRPQRARQPSAGDSAQEGHGVAPGAEPAFKAASAEAEVGNSHLPFTTDPPTSSLIQQVCQTIHSRPVEIGCEAQMQAPYVIFNFLVATLKMGKRNW